MPRFWGIHSIIHIELENSHMNGKSLEYMVPIDDRLKPGDFVYLMRDREYLYAWGYIQTLRKPELTASGLYQKIVVTLMNIRSGMADLNTQILSNVAFANYERQRDQNLSSLNDEQVRFLNGICRRYGSSPPDPEEARLEEDRGLPRLRPLLTDFILGQRLQMDETRFDEFKTVTSTNVMRSILDEVYGYVIGFLNLEDRRGIDYCRIFWGITDNNRTVVGVKLNDSDRDQLRRDVCNKLSRIKPPLAASSYYIELHNVHDVSGAPIQDWYVVEVGVGHGEEGSFYCSENDTFYLKQDGTNPQLKGQSLIAEIRRRLKSQLLKSLMDAQQQ